MAILGSGSVFGEMALIKNAPRAASIRSYNGSVELATLNKENY